MKDKNKLPVINGYTFSDKVMDMMKDNLKNTKKTGNEHGFTLCAKTDKNGDKIIKGIAQSKGDKGSVLIKEKCYGKKDEFVGSFHTHPPTNIFGMGYDVRQSFGDISAQCDVKEKIACVGSVSKLGSGKIDCYFNNDYDRQTKECKKGLPEKACSMVTDRCLDFEMSEEEVSNKDIKEYKDTLNKIYNFTGKKTIARI